MLFNKNFDIKCTILFFIYLHINIVSSDLIKYNKKIIEDANLLMVSIESKIKYAYSKYIKAK